MHYTDWSYKGTPHVQANWHEFLEKETLFWSLFQPDKMYL